MTKKENAGAARRDERGGKVGTEVDGDSLKTSGQGRTQNRSTDVAGPEQVSSPASSNRLVFLDKLGWPKGLPGCSLSVFPIALLGTDH